MQPPYAPPHIWYAARDARALLRVAATTSKCTRTLRRAASTTPERQGTVLIRNTQRAHPIDVARLEALTRHLLESMDCGAFDVGLWLTTDATVRRYNTQFRGVRKATDILSFPFHDDLEPGAAPRAVDRHDEDELNLGDMVVSVAYVARKAAKASAPLAGPGVAHAMNHVTDVEARVQMLVIHGLCHLLNYDHEDEAEFADMAAAEDHLLRERDRWLARTP